MGNEVAVVGSDRQVVDDGRGVWSEPIQEAWYRNLAEIGDVRVVACVMLWHSDINKHLARVVIDDGEGAHIAFENVYATMGNAVMAVGLWWDSNKESMKKKIKQVRFGGTQ